MNDANQTFAELKESIGKHTNWQYQLFKKIVSMNIDDLERLSCKYEVCHDYNCTEILRFCVPVHLPQICGLCSMGTTMKNREIFKFYWDVWNAIFTKAFVHSKASGILAGFKSFPATFLDVKLCSPTFYLSDYSIKLLVISLIVNKIIDRANSFAYVFRSERIEEEIGYTVIDIHREMPAISHFDIVTLSEGDFASFGQ